MKLINITRQWYVKNSIATMERMEENRKLKAFLQQKLLIGFLQTIQQIYEEYLQSNFQVCNQKLQHKRLEGRSRHLKTSIKCKLERDQVELLLSKIESKEQNLINNIVRVCIFPSYHYIKNHFSNINFFGGAD